MYHLLIVDDEIHAVRGIESGVEWERLDIAAVHTAFNIRQAKEVFESSEIDMMICDIEMPQGSGLELLAWVKERYPHIVSIFLTCHADFEYAKQAIHLGSLEYMLKPVRFAELEATLRKAVDKIGKERELASFNEMYKHYYRLWSMHQPMFAERFWLDLLKQKIPANSETIKDILSKQNIPFTETATFLPVLISVQHWRKSLTLREQNIMEYALRNAAEELILKAEGQIVNIDAGNLLVILPSDERLSDLRVIEQDCRTYIDACARNFYCDLSCYIGKPVSIQEMREMVASLFAMEKDNVAWQSGVFHKAVGQAIIHEHVDLPVMSGWAELLKQGSKDFLLIEIATSLDSLKKKPGLNAKLLQQFYQDFLQMIHYVLQVKGMQAHKIVSEYVTPERAASATRSIYNLQEWAATMSEQAIDRIRDAGETQSVVEKVKRYVSEHIHEDVSRADIANHVYLNPDYLTRLFKKETGLSIMDYILEERIEKTKELLVKTDLPVSGVSASVGYTNFSHFAKMFKKATNMSPHDYRKTNRES